jgi:glycosyltransferase involved in cell wall biosynthesis
LFLGNIIRRKGVHTLIQAVSLCKPGRVVLDVVGDDTLDMRYTRTLYEVIDRLGVRESVRMHGRVTDVDRMAFLKSAQAFAALSDVEGFGIVYLEAMGFGVPPAATLVGGSREIITDGWNGSLFSPGDTRGLADWFNCLAEDRSLLARLSHNARSAYLAHLTWREVTVSVRNFLERQL